MMRESTTLYLRGMPTRLVREAKAEAARRGVTLATLISDALERGLRAGEEGGDAVEEDIELAMGWYARNRSRLVPQYGGQYIAILEGKVIDHDRDFEALAARVFKHAGTRSVFMPHVQVGEQRLRVRSPRRTTA